MRIYLFLIFTAIFSTHCTRQASETSKLVVHLPAAAATNKTLNPLFMTASWPQLYSTDATGETAAWNSFINPTSVDDVNCYAVFVSGPGLENKQCTRSDGTLFKVGLFAGLFSAGNTLMINDVPSGPARTLRLVGWHSESGACTPLTDPNLDKSNFSEPHVLDATVLDLPPGEMSLTMYRSLDANTIRLTDCDFSINAPELGSEPISYGGGFDGDLIISSGTTYLDTVASSNNGRNLTSITQVTDLQKISDREVRVMLHDSWTQATHAAPGDEVMLYVAAENHNGDLIRTGCGDPLSGPRAGARTSSKVLNVVANGELHLEIFDSRFSNITTTQLTGNFASDTSAGTDTRQFCRLVAVRVPHLNRIQVDTTSNVTLSNNFGNLDSGNHNGGLMILRVANETYVPSGVSVTFDMSAQGFQARSGGPGESIRGIEQGVSTVNGNGGAQGGGGGHGGVGGGGAGLGGAAVGATTCGDILPAELCLFGPIYMGGAGGANASPTGHGGGIVRLLSKAIRVFTGGGLYVDADGNDGSGAVESGGAGGSVYVKAETAQVDGNFQLKAAGGATSDNVGAGAGGRIHFEMPGGGYQGSSVVNVNVSGGLQAGTGGSLDGSPGTCLVHGAPSNCP
ncbi:MAG: hypothetical protein KDD59_04525 [Bdellovibrionales bacterium]|nr:hypothetical protein [Bdellovibrionales bacterium]